MVKPLMPEPSGTLEVTAAAQLDTGAMMHTGAAVVLFCPGISSLLLTAGRTGRRRLYGRISWVFTVDNRRGDVIMELNERGRRYP